MKSADEIFHSSAYTSVIREMQVELSNNDTLPDKTFLSRPGKKKGLLFIMDAAS
jgi:hypothetical protein